MKLELKSKKSRIIAVLILVACLGLISGGIIYASSRKKKAHKKPIKNKFKVGFCKLTLLPEYKLLKLESKFAHIFNESSSIIEQCGNALHKIRAVRGSKYYDLAAAVLSKVYQNERDFDQALKAMSSFFAWSGQTNSRYSIFDSLKNDSGGSEPDKQNSKYNGQIYLTNLHVELKDIKFYPYAVGIFKGYKVFLSIICDSDANLYGFTLNNVFDS